MKKQSKQPTAPEMIPSVISEILAEMRKVEEKVASYASDINAKNWGHVGDLNAILSKLREINEAS